MNIFEFRDEDGDSLQVEDDGLHLFVIVFSELNGVASVELPVDKVVQLRDWLDQWLDK